MSNKIQDLEQEVLRCWEITQDLQLIAREHEHDNEVCDKVLAIATLYEMRFNKAWDTYEKVVKEYYAWKPREVNFDNEPVDPLCKICGKVLGSTQECAWTGCPLNWGDEASEKRQDIIGQNGNVGYGENIDG
jgi:hypothetical protein